MLRTAILRAARSASSQVVRKSSAIGRPIAITYTSPSSRLAPTAFQISRCYSAAASLSKPEVEGRIVDLLKNFDKVGFLARHELHDLLTSPSQVTDPSKVLFSFAKPAQAY